MTRANCSSLALSGEDGSDEIQRNIITKAALGL
jgi:hypothetical protein